MMSDVKQWLEDLKAGKVTVDEVAEKVAAAKWPERKPLTGDAFWESQADDPVPDPGPGPDLMQAYYDGTVTDEQFAKLYAAVPGGKPSDGSTPTD